MSKSDIIAITCATSSLLLMGVVFSQSRRIEELEDTMRWMLQSDLENIQRS